MAAPMLNRLVPLLCFLAVMLASFVSAPSAKASMSAVHCSIQWEKIKTTRDKAVLNSHLKNCSESKSGGPARARLAFLNQGDGPPPPPPPSRCDNLEKAARSGRERDLQAFVNSCPSHPQYKTASQRLQTLLISRQLAASTDARLKLGVDSYNNQEFAVAAGHFEAACNQSPQLPVACAYLGGMHETGNYVEKNLQQAISLYEKSCKSGFLQACSNAAYIYQIGATGIPVSQNKALEFLKIGCDGSDIASCERFSAEIPFKYTEPYLEEAAYQTIQKACELKVARACAHAGLNYYSFVTDKSLKYAKLTLDYFDKSCNLGDMNGCYFVGNTYYFGEFGRGFDLRRAQDLFTKTCQDKKWERYYAACINLGVILRDHPINGPQDVQLSVTYFKMACDVKISVGCSNLAYAYRWGKGVPINIDNAVVAYKSGCDGVQAKEAPMTCENLAIIYFDRRQFNQSYQYFNKACELDLPNSCASVGNHWEKGLGVTAKDKIKAIEFYQKALQFDAKQKFARDRLIALMK